VKVFLTNPIPRQGLYGNLQGTQYPRQGLYENLEGTPMPGSAGKFKVHIIFNNDFKPLNNR